MKKKTLKLSKSQREKLAKLIDDLEDPGDLEAAEAQHDKRLRDQLGSESSAADQTGIEDNWHQIKARIGSEADEQNNVKTVDFTKKTGFPKFAIPVVLAAAAALVFIILPERGEDLGTYKGPGASEVSCAMDVRTDSGSVAADSMGAYQVPAGQRIFFGVTCTEEGFLHLVAPESSDLNLSVSTEKSALSNNDSPIYLSLQDSVELSLYFTNEGVAEDQAFPDPTRPLNEQGILWSDSFEIVVRADQ